MAVPRQESEAVVLNPQLVLFRIDNADIGERVHTARSNMPRLAYGTFYTGSRIGVVAEPVAIPVTLVGKLLLIPFKVVLTKSFAEVYRRFAIRLRWVPDRKSAVRYASAIMASTASSDLL